MSIQTYAARRRAEAPARQTRASAGPGLSMDALRAGAAARETSGGRADLPGAIQARMDHAFGPGLSAGQFHAEQAGGEQAYSGPVAGSLSSASAVSASGPMQAKKPTEEEKLTKQVRDMQAIALARTHAPDSLSEKENRMYMNTLQNASPAFITELFRQQASAAQDITQACDRSQSGYLRNTPFLDPAEARERAEFLTVQGGYDQDFMGYKHLQEELTMSMNGARAREYMQLANQFGQNNPDAAGQMTQAMSIISGGQTNSFAQEHSTPDLLRMAQDNAVNHALARNRERRGFWGNLFHK